MLKNARINGAEGEIRTPEGRSPRAFQARALPGWTTSAVRLQTGSRINTFLVSGTCGTADAPSRFRTIAGLPEAVSDRPSIMDRLPSDPQKQSCGQKSHNQRMSLRRSSRCLLSFLALPTTSRSTKTQRTSSPPPDSARVSPRGPNRRDPP